MIESAVFRCLYSFYNIRLSTDDTNNIQEKLLFVLRLKSIALINNRGAF